MLRRDYSISRENTFGDSLIFLLGRELRLQSQTGGISISLDSHWASCHFVTVSFSCFPCRSECPVHPVRSCMGVLMASSMPSTFQSESRFRLSRQSEQFSSRASRPLKASQWLCKWDHEHLLFWGLSAYLSVYVKVWVPLIPVSREGQGVHFLTT